MTPTYHNETLPLPLATHSLRNYDKLATISNYRKWRLELRPRTHSYSILMGAIAFIIIQLENVYSLRCKRPLHIRLRSIKVYLGTYMYLNFHVGF